MGKSMDFDSLIMTHANDLYRFAFWLCRDQHRAEDLVQETTFRAWRHFQQLRRAVSAKSWLLTTLRREYYRRRPTGETVSLEDDQVLGESDCLQMRPEVDANLDIERRLAALSTGYREVLVLQLLFGYSTHEIASLLDTTEAAVANRLLRARRALRAAPPAAVCALRRAR
jgi:RNA polymerase sigma-70 factor, ECF subfamily